MLCSLSLAIPFKSGMWFWPHPLGNLDQNTSLTPFHNTTTQCRLRNTKCVITCLGEAIANWDSNIKRRRETFSLYISCASLIKLCSRFFRRRACIFNIHRSDCFDEPIKQFLISFLLQTVSARQPWKSRIGCTVLRKPWKSLRGPSTPAVLFGSSPMTMPKVAFTFQVISAQNKLLIHNYRLIDMVFLLWNNLTFTI